MKYEDLTPYQRAVILNGCGGKGSIIRPPYGLFFESSCNKHDFSYWVGGTEEDRIKADIGFFRAMLEDCQRFTGTTKTKYIVWAHVYFMAVRAFGSKYFNYTDTPRTERDLFNIETQGSTNGKR